MFRLHRHQRRRTSWDLLVPILLPLLGHSGAGSTWQALLVLASFGTIAIFLAAAVGKLTLDEPGDLVLPLAGTAVLASLSGATSATLSDLVGWFFPFGLAALVAVVLAASTSLSLKPTTPLALGAVVVALVAAFTLHTTIEDAWHPGETGLGAAWSDVELTLVAPVDGDTVSVGPVEVVVAVTGGTIGPGVSQTAPDDPEQLGIVRVFVDGRQATASDGSGVAPQEDCTSGCTQATYLLDLTLGVPVLSLEFLSADGQSFDTPPGQSPTVEIATVEAR